MNFLTKMNLPNWRATALPCALLDINDLAQSKSFSIDYDSLSTDSINDLTYGQMIWQKYDFSSRQTLA